MQWLLNDSVWDAAHCARHDGSAADCELRQAELDREKVRQWYPGRQEHRVIWRGPYIKGPAGAPLMVGEKAYLVDS